MFPSARVVLATLLTLSMATSAASQSLFIAQGERAAEGSVGWSVGPFSNGVETQVAASLDGRWDVGFGFNRYSADFGGDDDTTITEWSPSVRYFLFKENDDAVPVSFAAHAALFQDNYDSEDEGWYVLAGGQLFKRFALTETLALYPYVGFSLAGESTSFGGAEAERALYLTRQFGVHGMLMLRPDTWLRVTAEEHAFRRETYRAVRLAVVRRF
jgi:hypothetical protein